MFGYWQVGWSLSRKPQFSRVRSYICTPSPAVVEQTDPSFTKVSILTCSMLFTAVLMSSSVKMTTTSFPPHLGVEVVIWRGQMRWIWQLVQVPVGAPAWLYEDTYTFSQTVSPNWHTAKVIHIKVSVYSHIELKWRACNNSSPSTSGHELTNHTPYPEETREPIRIHGAFN